MADRAEVLVFSCHEDDIALLRSAAGKNGPAPRAVSTAIELTRQAITRRPVAVFLGVGEETLGHLDVIPMVHALHENLPAIVIAEKDSLELERRARQMGIFYYLVRPLVRAEVEAVLNDVVRCAGE